MYLVLWKDLWILERLANFFWTCLLSLSSFTGDEYFQAGNLMEINKGQDLPNLAKF